MAIPARRGAHATSGALLPSTQGAEAGSKAAAGLHEFKTRVVPLLNTTIRAARRPRPLASRNREPSLLPPPFSQEQFHPDLHFSHSTKCASLLEPQLTPFLSSQLAQMSDSAPPPDDVGDMFAGMKKKKKSSTFPLPRRPPLSPLSLRTPLTDRKSVV